VNTTKDQKNILRLCCRVFVPRSILSLQSNPFERVLLERTATFYHLPYRRVNCSSRFTFSLLLPSTRRLFITNTIVNAVTETFSVLHSFTERLLYARKVRPISYYIYIYIGRRNQFRLKLMYSSLVNIDVLWTLLLLLLYDAAMAHSLVKIYKYGL